MNKEKGSFRGERCWNPAILRCAKGMWFVTRLSNTAGVKRNLWFAKSLTESTKFQVILLARGGCSLR